ncbi:hypothetical protein [Gloeocapsopsis crepidinum]|uniref:hypothetical protein n=1 Tax=Gloeocapsopsis crepidinum TaxID=693223 RepID=UPI00187FCA8B|nr:hypothetical protein [Gloeocapsopsis crepidinum]
MFGKPRICWNDLNRLNHERKLKKIDDVDDATEGVRASYCSRMAFLLINLVVKKGLTDDGEPF